VLSPTTARNYPYAVAVHAGLTRGVWEIDHDSWRQYRDLKGRYRSAWPGKRPTSGPVFEAFLGSEGRRTL
jgi:hypothetical protein